MSDEPNYTVMGDDGNEYGPVAREQVAAWIREGRLERKSPVKLADARDWIFLESLPEFSVLLNKFGPAGSDKRSVPSKWLVVLLVLVAVGALVYFILKNNPF